MNAALPPAVIESPSRHWRQINAAKNAWWTTALAVAATMLAFATDAVAAPSLSSSSSQTFSVGQAATAASNPTVTDDATTATITAANDLRIRIPAGLNMTWDTTVTTVTLSGTASAKVSTTLLAYENSNKTLVLNVTSDFTVGQTLTISGLKFTSFTAVSAATGLQLVTAGSGGATADTDNRTKTIQTPTATLFSFSDQTFSVGQAATSASLPTVTDDAGVATITAANDIRIRIPAGLNMTWDTTVTTVSFFGTASGKVSTTLSAYEDSNKTLVLNVTSDFAAGQYVTIFGLKFANFTATSAATSLQLVTAGSGGATAYTDSATKTIQTPKATLSSASSQTFSIGQAATAASNPTVTEDAGAATITAANDLRIRIPAGLNMTWDTTVTTVTLSGSASGKVSTTLSAYEDSNKTLVLNVTSDFTVGQTLTVSGLKFTSFTAVSAATGLQLVTAGSGGATADTDSATKTIQVPTATLSSVASQTFVVNQAATAASNPTVTDDAGVATITAANDLRIRIPATFNMTWDTTVTTVTLSGTASGKVSTTLSAYEDSNKTLVLNVTSDFTVGQTLTVSGLRFTNFTAISSSTNLQLVTAGSGGATTDTDNRTKRIGAPTLSSAANQTFIVGQAATAASNPTITEDNNITTITAANDLRITIPATFNMTWDTTVTTVTLSGSAASNVSTTLMAYEDSNRTLVLNVTSDFQSQDTLTISGLRFTNFTAVSPADSLTLGVLGAGGAVTATDNRTKTITGVKLYFHDAATPNAGTLPGASTLSATTPNVTAATAGTNRDMNQTVGAAQASSALTTLAQTTLQKNWLRRFLSRPLAAQTLPTGVWTIQGGASESSTNSNMLPWGAVIKVWRPSTGTTVATLLDNTVLGTVEPGTTETNISSATGSINGVAVNDGDILVVELWAQNTQANATARTNTAYYDGTTEGSTSSNAAFLQLPGAITFYRSTTQSAYRLFDNANSTDVGTALAAQNTTAVLASTGAAFRLRTLIHVADVNLGVSGQAFKLQFVGKGAGTCAAPSGGTPAAYTDVTGATVIAYNNNATPADAATLTANANDPTHGADTVVTETYEELNNFTNPTAVNAGQDGKWDFSLIDNGATGATAYCFRAVTSSGTVLDIYTVYPEITTAAGGGGGTPGSFNAFETSTAADAITGVIKTRIAGSAFSLDVVAISAGAQQNSFSNNVKVELLANTGTVGSGYGADNCPTSNSVVQTIASAAIASGRSTVNFSAVADAYRDVRVRISYPTTSPTVTGCSTDSFAIRPNAFTNFTATDADAQTAGTARTLNSATFGAMVHKAGRNFTVKADAVNAAGTPAITTNYSGAPTTTLAACGGSAPCTPGFGALTLNTAFSSGQLASNAASYNEVGSFTLQLADSTFASIDSSDGSTLAERTIQSSAINVGRFVPDHFAVALNAPLLQTACTAGAFTYTGQTFGYLTAPVMTVTAQDASNNTTTFYDGSWWRITNTSATGKTYAAVTGTLDTSGITGTDPGHRVERRRRRNVDVQFGYGTAVHPNRAGGSFQREHLAIHQRHRRRWHCRDFQSGRVRHAAPAWHSTAARPSVMGACV